MKKITKADKKLREAAMKDTQERMAAARKAANEGRIKIQQLIEQNQ